jgi:hypothetical protein
LVCVKPIRIGITAVFSMRAPLTQSLGGLDLSSWRTCLRGAGAALTRTAMAATMEILTNILELDPGMQLSRELGGGLLFIPRVKLGSKCKTGPKLVHYRPVCAREQLLGGGAGTTGVRSENCRRPLQRTGSWHVERRAEGAQAWLYEAGRRCYRRESYLQFHEAYILLRK